MDNTILSKARFAELLDEEFARPLALQPNRKVPGFDPIRHVARTSSKHDFDYAPDVHVMLKREQGGYTLSIT